MWIVYNLIEGKETFYEFDNYNDVAKLVKDKGGYNLVTKLV